MIADKGLYVIYFVASLMFIFAIKGLSSPKNAAKGNDWAIFGMMLAIVATLFVLPARNDFVILTVALTGAVLGVLWGKNIEMKKLPQMIALLNGLGGLSSLLVGMVQIFAQKTYAFDVCVGIVVGAVAFTGSLVAFLKLQGIDYFKRFPFSNFINVCVFGALCFLWVMFAQNQTLINAGLVVGVSMLFGVTISLPVGGADMPIVISVLNACSGFAASAIGFALDNVVLIITGALVGASGTILALFMSAAMNKNLLKIFFETKHEAKTGASRSAKEASVGSAADAAFLMQNARRVIIVPGYGMAAAGAQYALKNMADILEKKYYVDVKFAIHPVAGRMPGHMNVLLAEAKVDYEKVASLDEINADFETADVAYVIGANDITNPSARTDSSSPLYGMPILDVSKAKTVFFVKRSLSAGYAGVENPLFFESNTLMLYGDAKKVTEEIIADL